MYRRPPTGITFGVLALGRPFSSSATARARRSITEIRKSRAALYAEETTPEAVRHLLERESDRAFGPNIAGNPLDYVNKAADAVWKDVLKASGNDPRVFEAWREDIKSRATKMAPGQPQRSSQSKTPPGGKRS